ncbi:MAG TPA: penicillin-binding transpeptidase domain-containing protein [Acidimicrobiales bacterium]|nr:penicillin-binding transpeptidase domain-containing protein [Acidimicrobiales bacterium]
MTRQIRLLGIGLMLCFLVLFVQLNRITVFQAAELNDNPNNTREILRDFSQPRGSVTTADGVVIADSVPSNDRFELQRRYPEGPLFAGITGYYSFSLGSAGVEKTYNDELAGRSLDLSFQSLSDLFVDKERVGNLVLTVRADLQRIAAQQLGDREGSVVALDPRTGAILAMVSFPSYDPNSLASHDTAAAAEVATALDADPNKPRLYRAYQDRFFPGSTFKVVTATAGLTSGAVTRDQPVYPTTNTYTAPGTNRPLRNFGGSTCGGALFEVLKVSCNTAFAQMGVETGPDAMVGTAEAFGFNKDVPIDLTKPARSNFPTDFERNLPALAQSAIGQNDVAATPLQMAMVAGAVANDGRVMKPHVMAEVQDTDGNVVDTYDPEVWTTAMDPGTAALMREAMQGVVDGGTASRLAVPGFTVGGKTGTAQLGTDPPRSHAWIIGWAAPPGEAPSIAVAVIIEGQEGASEQTGGRVAAPIAQALLQAYLTTP